MSSTKRNPVVSTLRYTLAVVVAVLLAPLAALLGARRAEG